MTRMNPQLWRMNPMLTGCQFTPPIPPGSYPYQRVTNNVLKIATINMKNFHSNKAYLQELTKHHDVICTQEHWLFNYEKENLQRFNDFSGLIKCIDDLDQISPFQRIRGYRGCGTLWNNKLNSKVIPVQDEAKD